MWFLLRMTFWLAVVLVLLPTGGSQTAPKSQVSAGEAFSAARGAVADFEHFCERQQEARIADGRYARPARASRRQNALRISQSASRIERIQIRANYGIDTPSSTPTGYLNPASEPLAVIESQLTANPYTAQPIINGSDLKLKSPISL